LKEVGLALKFMFYNGFNTLWVSENTGLDELSCLIRPQRREYFAIKLQRSTSLI